jgi:hypothetical protein
MDKNFPRKQLIEFLCEAKRRTYAAQGDEATVPPLLPDSRQLEYRKGPWFYRDIYFGMHSFVGQETVYYEEKPVWAMGYAGGLLVEEVNPEEVYRFLRAALRRVSPDWPYRGPGHYAGEAYCYRNESHGDVESFWGVETITLVDREEPLYQLRYAGGLLR